MQFPPYTTGTVSIANGDTTLVFTGGIITDVVARRGDVIYLDNENPGVEIFERTDTTHCEIAVPWSGGDKVNVPFTLVPNFPARVAGAEAAEDVTRLVAALNTNGLPWLVPTDRIDPDPSWGDEGQTAIQPATGKQWHKEGGVWVYDGVFKALGVPAPFDNGKTYSLNDVATSGGSSYVWINPTPGVGHPPPSATYWVLLAKQGEAATIEVGTVTTGASGSSASVTNSGTANDAVFDFTIPTGKSYGGTSSTSLAIGTGSKVFTTQAGLAYLTGVPVRAASTANTSNWMEGIVTYSGTTLTINVDKTNGSGTIASWNFNVSGEPGAGDLSSANNLSDLSNKRAAKDNISVKGADIASAATTNLETATGDLIDIAGSTTITALTLSEGHERTIRFTGVLTLTHGPSLVLPGAASIITATGDFAVFRGYASGVVRCVGYMRADGTIPYNNTTSKLTATNVQAAIDELKALLGAGMGFNDGVVDAGNAFWAICICPLNASTPSNAGLWNPITSGKQIRVDKCRGAIDGAGAATFGADVRVIPFALSTLDSNVPQNKKPNDRASVASCVYQASAPPGKPCQEMWLGRKDEDHTHVYDPAVSLPPGYCIFFGSADSNVAAISSWEFREENYAEAYVLKTTGTAISDMTNAGNAFDGSQTTYADLEAASFYVGKNWGSGVTKKISRFRLTSPDGRSFCGGNPAHSYTWYLEGSPNGSSWTQIDTGSYSEIGTGSTKDYVDRVTTNLTAAYQYHRVRMVDGSGSAGHRVAEVELWERL